MRIAIAGSMHNTEAMVEAKVKLEALGHVGLISAFADVFLGKDDAEKERIKIDQKNNQDAMREFWELMQDADALLVMNIERHGVAGYVGGNAFLEMGFAYILKQKIFLLNPVPDIKYYRTEIEAMKPVVINGDYSLIR